MMEGILLAAPVVDIDGTIFVPAAIFSGLMIVLKPLLFDPWLRTQDRRVEAIDGSIARAKQLRIEADEMAKDHDARLTAARERASDLRAKERHEEEAAQERRLAEVRATATAELERERGRIAAQAESARASLRGRVDELAKDVASKLLGRPVA
jgi:F-type H+-transporting ATPase subunit b